LKKPHSVDLSFSNLEVADRIVVTNNLNRTLKVIDDVETNSAVLAFLNRQTDGWAIPLKGVPVARIRLNFYHGERIMGSIGVERSFLTAQQYGGFYSKTLNEREHPDLLELIGLFSK
jgi:hypothetical protein